MAVITSTGNSTIKAIRALRQRKEREARGRYFIEGIRIVGEAVELQAEVEACVVAPDLLRSEYGASLVHTLRDRGVTVLEVSPQVFQSLSIKEGPQGIGAVMRQRWEHLERVDPAGDLCWVALDAVADPGNLGTILRTADAAGASGVILLEESTDPFDPTAARASMGAVLSQRLVRAEGAQLREWTRRHGCMTVGTSDSASTDYTSIPYREPVVLLMGSERHGLSAEQQAWCDVMVRIPMVGRSDSLNLAVATGIMLYEIFSHHRKGREMRMN